MLSKSSLRVPMPCSLKKVSIWQRPPALSDAVRSAYEGRMEADAYTTLEEPKIRQQPTTCVIDLRSIRRYVLSSALLGRDRSAESQEGPRSLEYTVSPPICGSEKELTVPQKSRSHRESVYGGLHLAQPPSAQALPAN